MEYFDGNPDESVYNGVKTILKKHTITVRRYETNWGNRQLRDRGWILFLPPGLITLQIKETKIREQMMKH